MIVTPRTRPGSSGQSPSAIARLVSGPTATSSISPGRAFAQAMICSAALIGWYAADVARVSRVALPVVAVHVVGVAVRAADQRMRGAERDGHVGQARHRERVRGVARRGLDLDVAPDRARGDDLDGRVQRGVEDGNGVIDARVDVEDDRRRGHAGDPAGTSSRPSVSRTNATDSRALCSAVLALTSSSMIASPS